MHIPSQPTGGMGPLSRPCRIGTKGCAPPVIFLLGVLALLAQLALRYVQCIARTSALPPARLWPSGAL
jgi:hypothetical protein